MEFGLSEEQMAIRELAASLFADFCSDEQLRAFDKPDASYDEALWRKLLETGLLSLALPQSVGGSGMGMLELMLVVEQQGRYLAQVPFWRHQLATLAIATFATQWLQAYALPDLVNGGCVATLELEKIETPTLRATLSKSGWSLDGSVWAVPLTPRTARMARAKWLLTPAQTTDGIRLCLIDLDAPGITRVDGTLTDGEAVANLVIASVHVKSDRIFGDQHAVAWLRWRAIGCVTALQLGVAAEALSRTAQYVSERQQFGRPIGSFQGVALRAADGYIDVEVLRTAVWQLGWRLDAGLDPTGAAHTAKLLACDGGHRIAHTAQHLHGGIGADVTYPIHRFFLRSRALEMTLGGSGEQRAQLGEWLANNETAEIGL